MFPADIIVEDDIVSNEFQDKLEAMLFDQGFPWYMCGIRDVTSDYDSLMFFKTITNNIFEHSQMAHTFVYNGKDQSTATNLAIMVLQNICNKYNVTAEVVRIKANLCSKVVCDNEDAYQTPHVDQPDDHWTIIYYAHDSDGDTFLFNEHYEDSTTWDTLKKITVHQRITPKKGRAVLFKGNRFHAGMFPRNNEFRIVLNFNFKILNTPYAKH